MKLRELKVEGFRSLRNVVWKPGDLNIVVGPNAGGKSNLLKVLEMISEAAKGKLGAFVDREGGMQALCWDGTAKQIRVSIAGSKATIDQDRFQYEFELKNQLHNTYRIANEQLEHWDHDIRGSEVEIRDDEAFARYLDERDQMQRKEFVVARHRPDETLLSSLGGIGVFGMQNELQFHDQLTWNIQRDFVTAPTAAIRNFFVPRHESKIDAEASNLAQFLHLNYTDNTQFRDDINLAMVAAYGDEFQDMNFPPAVDGRIQLRIRWNGLSSSRPAADLSNGTLRFLYLIALLASPKLPSLIAIDQPESELHPKMLPIIASFAARAAKRTQVIFTTHSPEFLNAFQDEHPTVTIVENIEGETQLKQPADDALRFWLAKYSLGDLYVRGQLEAAI